MDWQEKAGAFTYSILFPFSPNGERFAGRRNDNLKIELDDPERQTVTRSLVERRGRLIEVAGDTAKTAASRRSGLLELTLIASVLRKLRADGGNR